MRRARSAASSRSEAVATSTPAIRTVPELGRSSVPMMCSSVDLPEPEGPTIAHSSPPRTHQVDAPQRLHAAGVVLDDVDELQDRVRCELPLLRHGAHSDSITVWPSRRPAPSTCT